MDNQEQERAKAIKNYFDDVSEQYDEGKIVTEEDAIKRMRAIREKNTESDLGGNNI